MSHPVDLDGLDGRDAEIARAVAPILLLDRHEPFRPVAAGVSIFAEPTQSPSCKHRIAPLGERCVEYAIFWDHDIGHTYDLEHIWVHLSADDVPIAIEASQHGRKISVGLELRGNRPVLWVEAGKHAHFSSRRERHAQAEATRAMCGLGAGKAGVHLGNPFSRAFGPVQPADHRLAKLFLTRLAFSPAFGRGLPCDLRDIPLAPWPQLADWIPLRMRALIGDLRQNVPHFPAIFFDCGDTLIDEGTEVKRDDGSDVVMHAHLIDGAREMLDSLKAQGYRLCLVADGPRETFENVLNAHGLWDYFEEHVISGDVGVRKPDAKMFATAMHMMGLSPQQARQTPMVGNNLDRDILGANRAGHPSFFFDWSDRRRRVPQSPDDTPTQRFTQLADLAGLLQFHELTLDQDTPA